MEVFSYVNTKYFVLLNLHWVKTLCWVTSVLFLDASKGYESINKTWDYLVSSILYGIYVYNSYVYPLPYSRMTLAVGWRKIDDRTSVWNELQKFAPFSFILYHQISSLPVFSFFITIIIYITVSPTQKTSQKIMNLHKFNLLNNLFFTRLISQCCTVWGKSLVYMRYVSNYRNSIICNLFKFFFCFASPKEGGC